MPKVNVHIFRSHSSTHKQDSVKTSPCLVSHKSEISLAREVNKLNPNCSSWRYEQRWKSPLLKILIFGSLAMIHCSRSYTYCMFRGANCASTSLEPATDNKGDSSELAGATGTYQDRTLMLRVYVIGMRNCSQLPVNYRVKKKLNMQHKGHSHPNMILLAWSNIWLALPKVVLHYEVIKSLKKSFTRYLRIRLR